jgi:oxygen-dependent protoporphyrinogen oxidase
VRVAIIGGGISGLAAAWELRHHAEVTVFEPNQLGGCIRTTSFEGHLVDEGPDAFLTRVPDAVRLCEELGIADELVAPSAGRSMIWWDGRLRPLPEGLVLGVPRQMGSVIKSGILSPAGVARAALDLVLPRRRPPAGLTVRDLVADRFGAQVADRLVDPLVGGIHAGWTGKLGAAEVVPQLVAVAERSRSLLLGLRKQSAAEAGPMFLAPRGGAGRLVEVLCQSLQDLGVHLVAATVEAIHVTPSRRIQVIPDPEPFDAAVVATPAQAAAKILGPEGTRPLSDLPTASVAIVTASLSGMALPPGINGFLVPRSEGKLMTACSFASNKWPHWSDPGQAVVRISAGRWGDQSALDLSDADLVNRLVEELGDALGSAIAPTATRISRWPGAFPQYLPGHAARVADLEYQVARRLPAVTLAGATYRGSGIPACIASGRGAARQILTATTAAAN